MNLGSAARGAQAEEASGTPESGGPGRSRHFALCNPTFTGRTEVLEDLEERLSAGPVAVVALRGLGGVGKSQLALEYAHRKRRCGRYRLVGWPRADSPVTIAEDMAALAPLLGLPGEETVGEIADQVVSALRTQIDWLVVFDNAQKPGDLAGMLPGGRGHVLITSRNRAWSGVATQVDLGEFSRAEAVKFLCKRTGADEPKAAVELADELGDLPLALAQAAAYIDTQSMTIGGYLELYRDPVLARRLRDVGLDSTEYPASVARTWLLSFTRLSAEHPAAVELLRLCAFLDPDDIDLNLLIAGKENPAKSLPRYSATSWSALRRQEHWQQRVWSPSPLKTTCGFTGWFQAVTRDQLDDDETADWAKRALNLVAAILPSAPAGYRSWPIYAKLAPHIEAIAGHASSYPILAERVSVLRDLAICLSESGQLRAARTIFERDLAINKAARGPRHPEVAKALSNLGQAQVRLGELRDARATFERALVALKGAYGPDDPAIAKVLGNLGVVHQGLGELRDARATLEHAVAIFQVAYSSDSPDVDRRDLTVALLNLGLVQRELRELRDARATLERALAIDEAAYGPDHPMVGSALINLGLVQRDLRELRDARASTERALAIFRTAYGPDDPAVGLALVNLGAVELRLRKLRAGSASIERALAIFQMAYGPDHSDIMKALVNLGIIRRRKKITNYLISLAIKWRSLGS